MTPSPSLPYCCIHANPTYRHLKLAVIKLNGPPNPTIQAKLEVNSYRSGTYTLMLAEAQAAGTFHPALPSTGHWQSADVLLLYFGREVVVLDLLHQLPCWPRHHIVDSWPLESIESRSSSNSVSTHVFKASNRPRVSPASRSAQQCDPDHHTWVPIC